MKRRVKLPVQSTLVKPASKDRLFLDASAISKTGSDVNYLKRDNLRNKACIGNELSQSSSVFHNNCYATVKRAINT